MNFKEYKIAFEIKSKELAIPNEKKLALLEYAESLFNNNVPIIYDQLHFSYLVGYDYEFILSVCNSTDLQYKEYRIPKRNGKFRIINEPFPSLKEIQEWILYNILNNSVNQYISPVAKAYIPKQSIRDNARFHKGQKKLLCLDLVDFFGSVTYEKVYTIFCKFGYNKSVSTLLSNLCLLKSKLPQGSPTSPMLSNLVFTYYDNIIFDFCKGRNIRYTRYADDLSFSGDFKIGELISFIERLLHKTTFKINHSKTRVTSQGRSQQVTGIVVNNKIQTQVKYRKGIRQEIYYIIKFGLEHHIKNKQSDKSPIQYICYLMGKLNFILQINNKDIENQKYMCYMKELLKQYR